MATEKIGPFALNSFKRNDDEPSKEPGGTKPLDARPGAEAAADRGEAAVICLYV